MAKNKIIILNGPPGSGKDLIGERLVNDACWNVATFKEGIFDALRVLSTTAGSDLYKRIKADYNNRDVKELKGHLVDDMSIRDIMIHTSETCMKKLFGPEVFGQILASKMDEGYDFVITDGGFEDEINALISEVQGTHDVVLFQVRRHGKDFGSDSRRYVQADLTYCPVYELVHYENLTDYAIRTINMIMEEIYE